MFAGQLASLPPIDNESCRLPKNAKTGRSLEGAGEEPELAAPGAIDQLSAGGLPVVTSPVGAE